MLRKLDAAWFLARNLGKSSEILLPHRLANLQMRRAIYQTASHTWKYGIEQYSKIFGVVEYLSLGLDHCQDIVVLKKRG